MTLVWRPGYTTTFADPDVQAYLTAVEEADNASLEYPVAYAINSFVLGCKADGIWTAIKASCILAGARTLNGALVPLVGATPTNSAPFSDADYNRKTGLTGIKNLANLRASNADPQLSHHFAIFNPVKASLTAPANHPLIYSVGTDRNEIMVYSNVIYPYSRSSVEVSSGVNYSVSSSFLGVSRSSTSSFNIRFNNTTSQISTGAQATTSNQFSLNPQGGRIAFYSIGEFLNLSLLQNRITQLYNSIGAAIP